MHIGYLLQKIALVFAYMWHFQKQMNYDVKLTFEKTPLFRL